MAPPGWGGMRKWESLMLVTAAVSSYALVMAHTRECTLFTAEY